MLSWIYNSHTGAVNQLPTPQAILLTKAGIGWHGPFDTKRQALDFYERGKAANPGWKAPAGIPGQVENIIEPVNPANILGNVDVKAWLIRIGQILLGIVLIGVGVAKLSGIENVIAKAAKVAL